MGGRWRSARVRTFGVLLALPLMAAGLAACHPPGHGGGTGGPRPLSLTRPRILGAGADLNVVTARLDREPYRTVFARLVAGGDAANGVALDDHEIASERTKAKAAKDLAFEYAINRTEVGGTPAPFPTAAARCAPGTGTRHLRLMPARTGTASPSAPGRSSPVAVATWTTTA